MNVLWLASWFPGKTHATNGDFVERQAIALAKLARVTVLFVTKDATLAKGSYVITKDNYEGITVYRVYYGRSGRGKWLEGIFSFRTYRLLQRMVYNTIVEEQGRPDIIHVHVAMKAGLLAQWLKRKRGIPYYVTEHWTGYYPQSQNSLYEQHFYYRRLTKTILQSAERVLPVSADLGKTICNNLVPVPFTVIPNVVDTSKFFYVPNGVKVFRFIHPSYLNYQKNPERMIGAAARLAQRGYQFELLFVGRRDEALMEQAAAVNSPGVSIRFLPAVAYAAVAELMQDAQALLLFSRFENLPCVVLEALCCGLPVISTDVGGISEVIDAENGILVENEDVEQLTDAMQQMIDSYTNYDRPVIAAKATARFAYPVVAEEIMAIYRQSISQH